MAFLLSEDAAQVSGTVIDVGVLFPSRWTSKEPGR